MTNESVILRSVRWLLGPHPERGAAHRIVYDAQCETCEESADTSIGSRVGPEVWALTHTGRHPDHRTFIATQRTVWLATPAKGRGGRDLGDVETLTERTRDGAGPKSLRQQRADWNHRVRDWANLNGFFVSAGGSLPHLIVSHYLSVHPDDPPPEAT
ncbi:hypothetical protein ACIQAD_26545 [Streptomyces sp. NPDC088551]|uniref:DUF7848 domain-containing protein n=1 Tax=Streptomyces sp. NPDC088551 TaxID=3365863 RepID=UPI00381D3C4B